MNVNNLNEFIAKLEGLPTNRFDMSTACGSACCLLGWSLNWFNEGLCGFLDLGAFADYEAVIMPPDYSDTERYPLPRAIAMLKRLRDTYLSTGQVVVDWGPEPGEEPKTPWTAPHVAEVIAPTLPAEITTLLRPSLAKTEA